MLEPPPHGPSDSIYLRITGPAVDAEPASARPNPSRMVFLPRAITFSGMSSYLVLTINSETYFVRPGALASSSAGAERAASRRSLALSAKPARAREVLQKSRRIIWCSPFHFFQTSMIVEQRRAGPVKRSIRLSAVAAANSAQRRVAVLLINLPARLTVRAAPRPVIFLDRGGACTWPIFRRRRGATLPWACRNTVRRRCHRGRAGRSIRSPRDPQRPRVECAP